MTYEIDFTVSNCYDHHNDVSWRVGLGRDAGRDDFLPFTSHHITMNPQGDHIPPPRSDRNTFVHLRNSKKGKKKSSIACGARAKRKSSVATFPDFTLLGVFLQSGSSVPVFSLFKGAFCYSFYMVVARVGKIPAEGLFWRKWFVFVRLGRRFFLGDVDRAR